MIPKDRIVFIRKRKDVKKTNFATSRLGLSMYK